MADSTQSDTMALYLDLLTPTLITLIPGLVIQSFIIVVNVNDWLRGRSVTPVDHIITCLGISRLCAQCANIFFVFVFRLLEKQLDLSITVNIVDSFYCFCTNANIWLTSLLSIVFCLKISTLRTRLFLYLRRMIDQRTAYCIVALVIFSMFNCLLLLWRTLKVIKGRGQNSTIETIPQEFTYFNYMYNLSISGFIPLLFCCFSSVLLFSSLYHHITKMKMSGNLSINLETYYSAMRFIMLTFIYNIIFLTSHFASFLYYYFYCEDLGWLCIAVEFLPVLHSSYLIYRTAKLRSHMSKVLHNVIGFLFQRKDQETREHIELVDN